MASRFSDSRAGDVEVPSPIDPEPNTYWLYVPRTGKVMAVPYSSGSGPIVPILNRYWLYVPRSQVVLPVTYSGN